MDSDLRKKEEERMVGTWLRIKDVFYEKTLDSLDETAKTLVTLSSVLITIGFGVIGTLRGVKALEIPFSSIYFSLCGFMCFIASAVLSILVILRRPVKFEMLALPHEISCEWARIRSVKTNLVEWAYFSFGLGIMLEILAMVLLVSLGKVP